MPDSLDNLVDGLGRPLDADTKLGIRVRAKVREKWGGAREPELPEADKGPPRLLNLRVAPPEALPQNLVRSIERVARVSGDSIEFLVILDLNGCEIWLHVFFTGQSLFAVRGSAARLVVEEVLNKSAQVLREVIMKALAKDLDRLHERFGKAWLEGIG